jgi:hypothetical protein
VAPTALDRARLQFHRRCTQGHHQLGDTADQRHNLSDPLADESNHRDQHVDKQEGSTGP